MAADFHFEPIAIVEDQEQAQKRIQSTQYTESLFYASIRPLEGNGQQTQDGVSEQGEVDPMAKEKGSGVKGPRLTSMCNEFHCSYNLRASVPDSDKHTGWLLCQTGRKNSGTADPHGNRSRERLQGRGHGRRSRGELETYPGQQCRVRAHGNDVFWRCSMSPLSGMLRGECLLCGRWHRQCQLDLQCGLFFRILEMDATRED